MMLQTNWSQKIDPVLRLPTVNGLLLKNVRLAVGVNTIDHKLGRNLQGWQVVRQRAAASIFDQQDSNQRQALTLVLNSSAIVTVDLFVF